MASNPCLDMEVMDEPSLDELFAEPIVQLVMARDGVEAADMRGTLDRILRMYASRPVVQ